MRRSVGVRIEEHGMNSNPVQWPKNRKRSGSCWEIWINEMSDQTAYFDRWCGNGERTKEEKQPKIERHSIGRTAALREFACAQRRRLTQPLEHAGPDQ